MEHEELRPAETAEHGKRTHGLLFRLGAVLLVALLLLAALMVGGSFSKIISKGTLNGITINVAGFAVEAEEVYTPGEPYDQGSESVGDKNFVICSFCVTNESELTAICEVNIEIEINPSETIEFDGLTLLIYYEESEDDGIIFRADDFCYPTRTATN